MQIIDFTAAHIEQAAQIAKQNYEEERGFVPVLPPVDKMPDLRQFANNGMGVTAFDGDEMVGFLCSVLPFTNAFGSTDTTGVFSPMGANGAVGNNRANVYARLYQAAGEKWVKAGATSHAVCLYAHDKAAQEQFFRYGFGLRCIDAIRRMDEIAAPPCAGYDFVEIAKSDVILIREMRKMLKTHLGRSPCFMYSLPEETENWLRRAENRDSRIFSARQADKLIAFIEVLNYGEPFASGTGNMRSICGAFCLHEYRGKGVIQNLLNYVISKLNTDGCDSLLVDFESINPTAYGFWLKYFTAYTHSLVRRIDENAIK